MKKAAAIWETLESLPVPIAPANIYKAAVSVKCAEFTNRVRTHRFAPALLKLVVQFLDDTLDVVGVNAGDISGGVRALAFFAEAMPLTNEIFNDPAAYAMRQHVYDDLLLLAALRLGKEAETKKCINDMQYGVMRLLVTGYFEGSSLRFDPDKPQA